MMAGQPNAHAGIISISGALEIIYFYLSPRLTVYANAWKSLEEMLYYALSLIVASENIS